MMHTIVRGSRAGAAAAALATIPAHAQSPFVDVAVEVGLGEYVASTGDGHGPGAVFADLDNDGFPELYLMRAGHDRDGGETANHLYLNVPDGAGGRRFERLPDDGGAGDRGRATGAVAGDYDNDGDLDLYVINFDEPNALYQNQWTQTGILAFVDVTALTDPTPETKDDQFGVGMAFFEGIALDNSLTAAWADVDRDGDLDLYVGNHNGWFNVPIEGPFDVPGRRDVFYINHGDGTFSDMTMALGVPGYVTVDGGFQTSNQRFSSTNAVIFADFNNDRWPDLFVTNKIGGPDDRDMLYMNRGLTEGGAWGGFEMVTYVIQPTFGHRSGAAMGGAVGDRDNDGDLDIYITDWSNPDDPEAPGQNDLWLNRFVETGRISFEHSTEALAKFSWGTQWQDFDNNGFQDLHVATQGGFRDFLYLNTGATLVELAVEAGIDQVRNARTSLASDYNRDGWSDIFVANLDGGPSALFESDLARIFPQNHFLTVKLLGDAGPAAGRLRSTRDAVGARAVVSADLDGNGEILPWEHLTREVVAGLGNAASTASLELEFGLGPDESVVLQVLWPSGGESSFIVGADRFIEIDEATIRTGDIDASGTVDFTDLLLILSNWGECPPDPEPCPADVGGSGRVDVEDILLVLTNWG